MIVIVFPNKAAFDAFKAATPQTDESPFTKIGTPAHEFPGDPDAGTPPSGRVLVAHHFTAAECEYLKARGAEVRVGGIDGPAFGEESMA